MNDRPRPYSIRVFLPNGTPEGVRVLEKSHWTGVGLYIPRGSYPDAKTSRSELKSAGVYVLVGVDDAGRQTVYIGQSDNLVDRLSAHYSKRDWNWLVAFTAKDGSLNRAHYLALESRLIEVATATKRAEVENIDRPVPPKLSEADRADVDSFLEDVLRILPIVGLRAFEMLESPRRKRGLLSIKGRGVAARGYVGADSFVVVKGSQAHAKPTPSCPSTYCAIREQLLKASVLEQDGDHYRFTKDKEFSSPSAAGAVVLARATNGYTAWKGDDGKTLREIEEAAVASSGGPKGADEA